MEKSFLKKMSLLIVFLLAFSSAAFADLDSRVKQLENQMQDVYVETAMETFGAKTATARPVIDSPSGFITLETIFWCAKVNGTDFAYTDNDPEAALPIKGRVKDMEFDWEWGLRVGAGYNFQHDGWDLAAQYTWFDSNGSKTVSAGQNSILVPLRGAASIVDVVGNPSGSLFEFCKIAKSQYDFDFQSIDLDLGRAYYVSENLSFHPYAGLKTAWLDQEQTTRYTGGDPIVTALGLGVHTVRLKEECDFWGIGPRVGVDSKWYLGRGISVFSNIAAALLCGFFDVDHREKYSFAEEARIRLHANRQMFTPTAQFQLGLRYDTYIFENKQHIGIGLGIEAQYWWRQNQMLKINEDLSEIRTAAGSGPLGHALKYTRYSEDVAMYGITLDFKWDF